MHSSTQRRHCELCQATLDDQTTATQCRKCGREFHTSCAGVQEASDKFGCSNCYRVPGNFPRVPVRPQRMDSIQETSDIQQQPNTFPSSMSQEASAHAPRATTDDAESSLMDFIGFTKQHDEETGNAAGDERGSVYSTRSSRRSGVPDRDGEFMELLKQQGALLQSHSIMLSRLLEERSMRSGTSRRTRTRDWVESNHAPAPRESSPQPTGSRAEHCNISVPRPAPRSVVGRNEDMTRAATSQAPPSSQGGLRADGAYDAVHQVSPPSQSAPRVEITYPTPPQQPYRSLVGMRTEETRAATPPASPPSLSGPTVATTHDEVPRVPVPSRSAPRVETMYPIIPQSARSVNDMRPTPTAAFHVPTTAYQAPIMSYPVTHHMPHPVRRGVSANTQDRDQTHWTGIAPIDTLYPAYQPSTTACGGGTWNVSRVNSSDEFFQVLEEAKSGREPDKPPATKLPNLPKFNGSELEWPTFIVSFLETTYEGRISDVRNLERLRACLGPEPSRIFNDVVLHSTSLNQGLEQLRLTYGQPQGVTAALEEEVMACPKVEATGKNLQRLALKTMKLTNHLSACGFNDALTSQNLVSRIQGKLPLALSVRWGARCRVDAPTLGNFSRHLQEELENLIIAGQTHVRLAKTDKSVLSAVHIEEPGANEDQTPDPAPATTLSRKHDPGQLGCAMCQDSHGLTDCPRFKAATDDARMEVVNAQRLCWRCLKAHAGRCEVKTRCAINNCTHLHHKLLHTALEDRFSKKATPNASTSASMLGGSDTLCKIIPVRIQVNETARDIFCFIDEGSQVSLIDAALAEELGATGPTAALTIKWTNSQYQTDHRSRRTTLTISAPDGPKSTISNVRTMKDLDLPEQSLDSETVALLFPDGGGPPPYHRAKPLILLGLQHAILAAPREIRADESTNYLAARTRLGWTIYGGGRNAINVGLNYRVCHIVSTDNYIDEQLKRFFSVESFGVRAAPKLMSLSEERALETLQRTVRKVGERYEAGLLWSTDDPLLPSSEQMCKKRACQLNKKLKGDPELADKLQKLINDYRSKGYCTDVSGVPARTPLWYLPVFSVANPNKPEKVRMVWDAAAKVNGASLNSFLLAGPDLLAPLPEVLMRFRERKVGVTADVSEMFHQVRIRAEDRDAQRFLWYTNDMDSPQELRLEVMTFGACCSPTTAQYIQKHNAQLYKQDYPDAVDEICRSYYVDDQLSCFDNETTAARVVEEVAMIQKSAGFQLHKWRSSHDTVLRNLAPTEEKNKLLPSVSGGVLGMTWNSKDDCLCFAINNTLKMRDTDPLTRRKMLSGTMSLFDPLGLAANMVIKAKLLLKSCLKMDWDAKVPERLKNRWQEWCNTLLLLSDTPVPRFHGISPTSTWELHTFVDASEEAMAAATYVRGLSPDGSMITSLVMAKTRVAPVRAITMPRMELMAAVLGTRLAVTVITASQMAISRRVFWSDSQDVMCWIRSSHRRYHAFVAARVNEILDTTREEEWRWLPSRDNVADDATRFSSPIRPERWYSGPDFLRQPENEWPVATGLDEDPKEELAPVMLQTQTLQRGLVPDSTRFSKWDRFVRATAYALRFFYHSPNTSGKRDLLTEELNRAEEEIFRAAQYECYADVIEHLRNTPLENLPRKHALHKLCPMLDEKAILRVNGRLPPALFPVEVRQPVIISPKSHVVRLYVEKRHREFLHGNHDTVVNEIRRHFYVPGLRRCLKAIANECLVCRINRPRVNPPMMGTLPEGRAALGWKAFTYCNVDNFGPYEVVVGRRREKRWGTIFTCSTTRAVHIEVAHSLDMASCLMCVRMMCARRDVFPLEIRSDCGTNFKAAAKELETGRSGLPKIVWKFNPPGAPHMGGAWERMIRTIKRCFTEVVGERALTDETLRCALIEAESIVNKHPLTDVPTNPLEETALTPNDFLTGAHQRRHAGEIIMGEGSEKFLRRSWRDSQQIADHFWRRFSREVIPVLNLRTKWFTRQDPLKVGDVVMVADDAARGAWRKAVVVEAIGGRNDDQVRQVRLRTAGGSEMFRPAVKVARIFSVNETESVYRGEDVGDQRPFPGLKKRKE